MEDTLPILKTKIFFQNEEFMEIQTPTTYYNFRETLENNPRSRIPKNINLNFMDDFGNMITLDQNSYNDFREMTNGICYYVECTDIRLKDVQNTIIASAWQCYHCFTQNEADNLKCKICERLHF